jgi:mono/diheme cytochrome c family protein
MLWLASTACSDPDRSLPAPYRTLAVPAARLASPAARERGQALFREHCALCHGERADGVGQRARWLSVRPPAFSSPIWRSGATPRRVYFAIREGVRGTPMPAWRGLSTDDSWDLTAYVLSVAGEGP